MTARPQGLFALLRRVERNAPDAPRIGRNDRLADEIVRIGQDPYLAFPASDVADHRREGGRAVIRTPVLGHFGPQGPLPLNTTEEVLRWRDVAGDPSFVALADLLGTRFVQLFFRAWSDSRAIGQFDRPDEDRFAAHVGALAGVSTPAFRNRDGIPDVARTRLVGLHATRVKSGVRLRQLIELYLSADVAVQEHVPSWIAFDASDHSRMGRRGATLGRDARLGTKMRSVNDRIRIRVAARDLDEYRAYLPGGVRAGQLLDLVRWYLGEWTEVEVALSLPADAIPPATLGRTAQLGWMAAMAPGGGTGRVDIATYDLDDVRGGSTP
ncbi:type VI secretion system baseplate subunit TssG [Jannaschia sp. LMIT008]|uniref:type VI secretion system baseplate subunit TssG n=1 Tax=Jannaschia maritima TaxID=3032585 RepID=UPI002811C099|nr:type VI secretion system baseplate subunit TssG [Jannaschia sp. LMIT008]